MANAIRTRLDMWGARRSGRRDGRRGIPGVDESVTPPFDLLAIRKTGEEKLAQLHAAYTRDDEAPRARHTIASRELQTIDAEALEVSGEVERLKAELERSRATAQERREQIQKERVADLDRLKEQLEKETGQRLSALGEVPLIRSSLDEPDSAEALDAIASDTTTKWEFQAPELDDSLHRRHGITGSIYWGILLLLIAGEIPLNAIAFRLFGEAELLTWVMTGSLATVLILAGHGLGLLMARRADRTGADNVFIGVLSVVPALVIVAIGIVRGRALEEEGGDLLGLGAIAGVATFSLINILIYVGAAMLSYLRHDPETRVNRRAAIRAREKESRDIFERRRKHEDKERVAALQRQKEAEKRLEELRATRRVQAQKDQSDAIEARSRAIQLVQGEMRTKLESQMGTIDETAEQKLVAADAARRELEAHFRERAVHLQGLRERKSVLQGELEGLETSRLNRLQVVRSEAIQIQNYYERLMAAYCAVNIRTRKDHVTPPVLRDLPPLEIPEELLELKVG